MAITLREYRMAAGAKCSADDAAIIGPELERLAAAGASSAGDIVAAAADDDSPLHRYFDWNDARAARRFRLMQASVMARSVTVVVRTADGTPSEPRLAFSLHPQLPGRTAEPTTVQIRVVEPRPRGQPTPRTIDSREVQAADLLMKAADRLLRWRSRYAFLAVESEPIGAVVTAIDELERAFKDQQLL